MIYKNENLRALAEDVKFELISARRAAKKTQAQVAAELTVNPKIYEAWENTDNENQPHAAAMLGLPFGMSEHMVRFFCSKLGGTFLRGPEALKLNGSTEDEEKEIIIFLGKATELAEKDPTQTKKLESFYDHIIEAAQRAKKEVKGK